MGFRTTIISEDLRGVSLPKWFVSKWSNYFNFGKYKDLEGNTTKDTLLIASKNERKFYDGKEEDLFLDLQKIIREKKVREFILVMLHECGGITRVQIESYDIRFSEPVEWKEVENVTHDYCYGCSDLESNNKPI